MAGGARPSEVKVRAELSWFVQQMELKLRKKDHKTGWKDMRLTDLFRLLLDEVRELDDAIVTYNDEPDFLELEELIAECADVANFAMMIADAVKEQHGRTD